MSVCGCDDLIWNPYLFLFAEISIFATRLLNLLDHPPGSDVALELSKCRGQLPTFKLKIALSWFLSPIFGVTLGVFCLSSHKFMTKPRAWAPPTEHSSSPSAGPNLENKKPELCTWNPTNPHPEELHPASPNTIQILSLFSSYCFSPESRQPPPPGFFFLIIHLCEVSHVVWLYGIPWFTNARIPFHLHCNAYGLSNSLFWNQISI